MGSASYEALRVTSVSNIEHFLALPQNVFRLAIVNRGWRQQADARMTVLVVVPPKKTLTESTAVLVSDHDHFGTLITIIPES